MNYLCIHCHFYQPPRENAWLEAIELQDSAYPYHDWNERVDAECYSPNSAARILDEEKRITRIVNNYANISFNFGPTLLSWAAEHSPHTYQAILDADRQSQLRFAGHGSAMAQAYNHIIMPLASRRDKQTQIAWGWADFLHRFKREPEGMWLPETAVDSETLDLLATAGVRFVVLAPHQAKAIRPLSGSSSWVDVSGGKVDPARTYLCHTPSGRSINLFFYDGPVSQAVAFEKLLDNGEKFARRLTGTFHNGRSGNQLSHIATDGETYGHHHKHGEMALAYALEYVDRLKLATITNYGEFLALNPPAYECQIQENSAWSCMHGVERWRSDCGCNAGHAGWNQKWRQPLRESLDWLRDWITPRFEKLGSTLLVDPWAARDAYISVVLQRDAETRKAFGGRHFRRTLSGDETVQVWKLMELQRNAMLMYTSCGWFFDDISGIETVQVIQYAGRVVQLAEDLFAEPVESEFLNRLALAKSNVAAAGTGRDIYLAQVHPAIVDLRKVGAHYAISGLFSNSGERTRVVSYGVRKLDYHAREAGKLRMAVGQAEFTSEVTCESEVLAFWVVHFGDHNVAGGVKRLTSPAHYERLLAAMDASLACAEIPEVVRLLDREFGAGMYSLRSLFRDEQRRIVRTILSSTVAEAEMTYLRFYEQHAALMRFVGTLGTAIPREFTGAMEYALNGLLRRACSSKHLDESRIEDLLQKAQASNIALDHVTLEFLLRRRLESLAQQFAAQPQQMGRLQQLRSGLRTTRRMPFAVNLWLVQNVVYSLRQRRADSSDQTLAGQQTVDQLSMDQVWADEFRLLNHDLAIQI